MRKTMRQGLAVSILALVLALTLSLPGFCQTVPAESLPELDCLIEPETTIDLASAVDGVIESLYVDKGDAVAAGQPIARLQSLVEEAQLRLAQARAERSDHIRYHQANSQFNERRKERFKKLPKNEVISALDLDDAENQAVLARLELRKAQTDKYIAEFELAYAQAQLNLRTIRSPMDGVVVQRYLQPGESTENKAIIKLARIDPLKVEAYAPASLVGKVAKGMEAELSPEVPSPGLGKATVSVVDPIVDAASGSFGIRLSLPNPEGRPLGGLKCKVRFLPTPAASGVHPEVPAVPGGR